MNAQVHAPMAGRVVTLGSVNIDTFARVSRLPVPGETLIAEGMETKLGGKGANQAVAAARAGVRSLLLAAVGKRDGGEGLISSLRDYGVDTSAVRRVDCPSGRAFIFSSSQDNQIVVVAGANSTVDYTFAESITLDRNDVCLAQMETPADATMALFKRARAVGATTVLNAAPAILAARELVPLADVLLVNESELAFLSAIQLAEPPSGATVESCMQALSLMPRQAIVVTLGSAGAMMMSGGVLSRIDGRRVKVVDTTGAGDCFCGYLAAGLARGESLECSAARANAAASFAVQIFGAANSIPRLDDVEAAFSL